MSLDLQALVIDLVRHAVRSGYASSAHDLSSGGLATALAESCLASGLGAEVDVSDLSLGDPYETLFGEGPGVAHHERPGRSHPRADGGLGQRGGGAR